MSSNVSDLSEGLIDKYVLEVNEYDDRTSPEDWPEALLITSDELHGLLKRFAADLATLSPPASPQGVEQYVEDYEYRLNGDAGYRPTEAERDMLIDAIHGYLADRAEPR